MLRFEGFRALGFLVFGFLGLGFSEFLEPTRSEVLHSLEGRMPQTAGKVQVGVSKNSGP